MLNVCKKVANDDNYTNDARLQVEHSNMCDSVAGAESQPCMPMMGEC